MSDVFYNHFIYGPLTKEEYWNILRELPNSSNTVVAEYHGFKYNTHGICLNPNKEKFGDKYFYVELRTAKNKSGRWVYAIDYSMKGGGCSYGVSCKGEGFEAENEAKFALLCYAEQGIRRRIESKKLSSSYLLDEDDEFDYREKKSNKSYLKSCQDLLKKVLYYQDIYSNQTLF